MYRHSMTRHISTKLRTKELVKMKNTKRLIKLLQQREEMVGLPSDEYDELLVLLEEEVKSVKETLYFYEKIEEGDC